MKKALTPFVVGILVLFAFVSWFVFFNFVKKEGRWTNALTVTALFKDASGLGKKSGVLIAGIPVGEIVENGVQLEGNKARVKLRIGREIHVHTDARLVKRSQSLVLSDYVLDLYPGSDSAPDMPEGGEIKNVVDSSGLDEITGQFKDITTKIDSVMGDIQRVTQSLSAVLGGEKGVGSMQGIIDDLSKITASVSRTTDEVGEQLQAILTDVRGVTSGEEGNYKQIIENIRKITEDMQSVLKTVKGIVGSNEGDLKESVTGIKETLSKLDESLDNLKQITDKVAKGEGPVGTLLNNEKMARTIQDTVEQVGDFASRLTGIETQVTLRSDYLFTDRSAKTYASLWLIPKPDKYYILEVVSDPRGVTSEQTTVMSPVAPLTQVTRQNSLTNSQTFTYSAEFGKRFYFVTLRFGIIESNGGVGIDLHLLEEPPWLKWVSFTVTADVFNFSSTALCSDPALVGLCPVWPNVRAYGNLSIARHLFVAGGVTDAMNNVVRDPVFNNRVLFGRSWFLGGGIYFTDDDLKAILAIAPKP
jgi:phospholipid/cholesterol/gamma-HCH transport system substrate-binding protein